MSSVDINSLRWSYTTVRWSLATSSYSSSCLRMSKLRPSTLRCDFSMALDTMRCSMASPFSIPSFCIKPLIRSGAKIRSKLSSNDKKKREEPGSPWRPARPRSWLSIRRDSWRSVPMMWSPPAARTKSWRICQSALASCFSASVTLSPKAANSTSNLPPKPMSVPRPAMLVAIVTAPGRPASAIILASRSCCLALSTLCGTSAAVSAWDTISDISIDAVPTKTGRCSFTHTRISSIIASNFSVIVKYTRSFISLRLTSTLVGITNTSKS